ncbi:MAG: UDP-glucose:(heptosyl)LPS alpha,3-glucosyltransferase [Chthoniobacter sp.]|jgi:UDP-glucose:(heptosyl)LPS alpha-1,3-glucosyltransferase|nr:UDP-glucose:(heptosyl)LPS alpha,3-glucosyltransferase [Chthoniobacter sp.]
MPQRRAKEGGEDACASFLEELACARNHNFPLSHASASCKTPLVKIALSAESFDPSRGGLESWSCQFAEALVALGHEVHLVEFDFSTGDSLGTTRHPLAPSPSPMERAGRLEQCLRGLNADIIHDMGCGWFADIFHPHGGSTLAWREHNLRRIPAWRRVTFWQEKRYRERREIEKRQHASGALIVAVSRMTQRHFVELHGLAATRLPVIQNGVDTEKFAPKPHAAREQTTFLLVAHNLALKNAPAAIRAIARLRQKGKPVRLVVAGSGTINRCERLASRLDVRDAVDFCGAVSDMPGLYSAADVCVHPTWYDPCSLVTLEALASGLPVITTRSNGAAESMREGEQGFVLDDPADDAALGFRMELLLDCELRQRMSLVARAAALEQSFEKNVQAFVRLYEEVRERKVRAQYSSP